MLKRLSIVPTITDAKGKRADITGSWVCVAELTPNRWLVKQTVDDAAVKPAGWVCDIACEQGAEGRWSQKDIVTANLTAANRTTIRNWLQAQGVPNAWVDATVTTRAELLWKALKLGAKRLDIDLEMLRHGYDVSDGSVGP